MNHVGALHLSEVELPVHGKQVSFRHGNAVFWLRANSAKSWTVIGDRGAIVGHFVRKDGWYVELDDDAGPGERREDWRRLVAVLL